MKTWSIGRVETAAGALGVVAVVGAAVEPEATGAGKLVEPGATDDAGAPPLDLEPEQPAAAKPVTPKIAMDARDARDAGRDRESMERSLPGRGAGWPRSWSSGPVGRGAPTRGPWRPGVQEASRARRKARCGFPGPKARFASSNEAQPQALLAQGEGILKRESASTWLRALHLVAPRGR